MVMERTQNGQIEGVKYASKTCDNPKCEEPVDWPKSAQRPSFYCNASCRRAARRAVIEFEKEIEQALVDLSRPDLTDRQRRFLKRGLQNARWALGPYPPSARRDA
jgi:hypothetical protein